MRVSIKADAPPVRMCLIQILHLQPATDVKDIQIVKELGILRGAFFAWHAGKRNFDPFRRVAERFMVPNHCVVIGVAWIPKPALNLALVTPLGRGSPPAFSPLQARWYSWRSHTAK